MPKYLDRFENYPTSTSETVLAEIGKISIKDIAPDTTINTLDILTPSERAPFEHGFAQSARVYERIGITPPPLEMFEQSGVDFIHLSHTWVSMVKSGAKPAAVFAKANLSIEEAKALYTNLRADTDIPNNPLRRCVITASKDMNGERRPHITYLHDGLAINSGVIENWQKIVTPMQSSEAADGWTLRLIASSNEASAYDTYSCDGHATIPEYLTLQATLIQAGEQPIDQNEFVWLHCSDTFTPYFIEHPRAPIGKWEAKEGYVFLGHDRVMDGIVETTNRTRLAQS